MNVRIAAAIAALAVLAAAAPVRGQEPTPPAGAPPVVWVTKIDGGGYRVVWDGIGAADSWLIRIAVGDLGPDGRIDTQRRLDEYQLAQDIPGADIWYDLPSQLVGVLPGGCTYVAFSVFAMKGVTAPDPPGESVAYEVCGGIAGKPLRFPALDAAPAVDPEPPADVRLERIGTAWQLTWLGSDRVAYYDPGVLLFDKPWPADPTATGVGSIDLPLVAASERSVILPQRVTTEPPPPAGCYYALLMVFAVGQNGRVSAFPGNTTERICTDGARIASFPATGAGAKPSRDVPAADVIAMLALAGGAALVLGSLGKRRR